MHRGPGASWEKRDRDPTPSLIEKRILAQILLLPSDHSRAHLSCLIIFLALNIICTYLF